MSRVVWYDKFPTHTEFWRLSFASSGSRLVEELLAAEPSLSLRFFAAAKASEALVAFSSLFFCFLRSAWDRTPTSPSWSNPLPEFSSSSEAVSVSGGGLRFDAAFVLAEEDDESEDMYGMKGVCLTYIRNTYPLH